jgi:hypothetical protein
MASPLIFFLGGSALLWVQFPHASTLMSSRKRAMHGIAPDLGQHPHVAE